MIQLLNKKYRQAIAYFLMLVSYIIVVGPAYAGGTAGSPYGKSNTSFPFLNANAGNGRQTTPEKQSNKEKKVAVALPAVLNPQAPKFIGGPSQPEMSSFKSVGTDNMVNLFTGDFNYNIPLLDVGGYPVNIYYDGNISMEQEASWVGLGWNINPGNINRNMRGIPDDFDGTDTMVEEQMMKPNKTWGVRIGGSGELTGVGLRLGENLGFSLNNYLGPAMDLDVTGGIGIEIGNKAVGEKSPFSLNFKLGADISSRDGVTFSPSVSMTANSFEKSRETSFGLGLSTGFNSRSGIKALQLSEQASFNDKHANKNAGTTSYAEDLASTSITFAKPSYTPAMRMPLTNTAWSGNVQVGTGLSGVFAALQAEVYCQQSRIAPADSKQYKPMVGYLYYQKAVNNPNAIMDFTRFNDKEVTPNTPIISAPQYSYDVFSIQGEGTGGSVRAYRNDLGYVRDNLTQSQDGNNSFGFDAGIPGHYGLNFNTIQTPSYISEWQTGNKLHSALAFGSASGVHENVFFRNPGETCVLDSNQYAKIGNTDLVRFQLGGFNSAPTIEPLLQHFDQFGNITSTTNPVTQAGSPAREKRTQVVSFLTACEAARIGLDTAIRSYNRWQVFDSNNNLSYTAIPRVGGYRKGHHISQINVTESDGKRYVYGIPVYNTRQKDFTFSLNNSGSADADHVAVSNGSWMTTGSNLISSSNQGVDGYVQITTTPAYTHSFLLSGLLSPDYVDVTGNGISDDDIGEAVKFNYTMITDASNSPVIHKWRTPLTLNDSANFNAGNRTESKDDKGIVSYGERESWYVHSIESKTMIAIFTLQGRNDGKGPADSSGGISGTDSSERCLKQIDLYNKADIKANGFANAKPIKTVHFSYSYTLCNHTPDNTTGAGKLTLDSIYFTFNGQNRANKNKYAFSYVDSTGAGNPGYALNASDRWNVYKPIGMNPGGLKNKDYPYSIQDTTKKPTIDSNAAAWALKKILLPSGGQIEVQYETDDYAYVQNLRATQMMQVVGFGRTADYTVASSQLYNYDLANFTSGDAYYVFIQVPQACTTAAQVQQYYLDGVRQLAFKYAVYMPQGPEYINTYATVASYGITGTANVIWVQLNPYGNHSPLLMSALEYLRTQLPDQAFSPGYSVPADGTGLQQVGDLVAGMFDNLVDAFTSPIQVMISNNYAQYVDLTKCFVRLNNPVGRKYGGGSRVKEVLLKDNWQPMTGQYTSMYGQTYDYTTTENFFGVQRTISSGVASYEPAIGGEENPFQTIIQVVDDLPLGPASYGAVEMPVLDAFFPAPCVGYSKVTVRSLPNPFVTTNQKSRSGIGKQVTEYFTAKDYPVYYSNTGIGDAFSDKEEHDPATLSFFYKYALDTRALSQGFLVATNDMHGKMKSQSSYAENDTATRINYTQNFYRNTGATGMGDQFYFANAAQGGAIRPGNMGIDIELMTDTREFDVKSHSTEIQGQLDWFPEFIFLQWIPFVWPVVGESENTYRAVTTTKVINYHAVLDSVIVIDKGSQVSTKNLVYDAETGSPLVTRTNNEFDKAVYNTSYPAYWAYSGMGPAYKNIDAVYNGASFSNGKINVSNGTQITPAPIDTTVFESGDELLILQQSSPAGCDAAVASPFVSRVWAFDTAKNSCSLTNPSPYLVFIDSTGNPFTAASVSFRIVRSGKRNMLNAQAATVTSMLCPFNGPISSDTARLFINDSSRVLNASAIEYKEKWQTDDDVINTFVTELIGCDSVYVPNCTGYLERQINPYSKGLLGNFRAHRNMVFYDQRAENDITPSSTPSGLYTNLPKNGFLNTFNLYWNFNGLNNLVPGTASTQWVWNNKSTRINARGLELETKNALNIYTAAQYGYAKSLPTAITNNAAYGQAFYDGFEDYNYTGAINGETDTVCRNKKYVDLSLNPVTGDMQNSQVVNTDTMKFNAHTGNFVMGVAAGNSSAKTFNVASAAPSNFNLKFGSNTAVTLYNEGTNAIFGDSSIVVTPAGHTGGYYTLQCDAPGHFNINLASNPASSSDMPGAMESFRVSEYIQITKAGVYTFQENFNEACVSDGVTGCGEDSNEYYIKSDVLTSTLNITPLGSSSTLSPISSNWYQTGVSYTLNNNQNYSKWCLQPGIYNVSSLLSITGITTVSGTPPSTTVRSLNYYVNILNPDSSQFLGNSYYNSSNESGCVSTIPIPGNDSMLNPIFTVPDTTKMVFSAWVHQVCGNLGGGIPCAETSFDSNQVNIQFLNNGTVVNQPVYNYTGQNTFANTATATFKPAGPIIDGWQRYEGYFSAPATATAMTLSFVNNSAKTAYFDDIRVFPYNADMKSYIYDPVSLRLTGQLDANNYASFYEYDEEGTLIRTKAETIQGIKTINETRSAKQRAIVNLQ